MSSRGRGFNSRGGSSYRGRGGGNDWNNSNSTGRGSYPSSRGRFNKYNSNSNYDSRNKYNSGGTERYTSRGGRGDHSNAYKRPRDSYSGRDDHRSSSDSGRKRMRNDSYQGGGSSSSQRYSGSYGGSSASGQYDDNKRSSSSTYEDKRNDRNSYHRSEDRHSATRSYTAPQPPRISDMAPPAPRYTSSRGRISRQSSNYRGRSSTRGRGGGMHRGTRSDVILSRKRTLGTLDYRRKLLGSRSRDYIQRVRMTTTKMRRSSGTTRLSGSKKDSAPSMKDKDRMAKAINAEFSDEDDDDNDNRSNWDEDEKPHGEDDENAEEDEDKAKKEDKVKPKQERTTEDEEEKDDVVKDDEEEDPKPDEDDEEEVEGKEEDAKEENARSGSDELPSRRDGRRFIKLNCSHCQHRSVTFKEYSLHLYSGKHNSAMRRVAAKHKAMLARMRVVQRQEQRRVEARDAARGTLPSRTIFCPVCKLNYRSLKAVHNLSDSHRQIKRFLTPFCRVCRIQFRSPMLYETHICSLDHIKRKSLQDDKKPKRNGDEANSSAGEDEDKEMNLDNFMTLDSVGDVDAEEDEENGDKKKKDKSEGEVADGEKKAKTKQMIKVGSEYIKRVEVQFCELCKVYLPRSENNERAVALHCSTRSHLKRYVRDNDDKALRRQAERIHLQSSSSTATSNSLNTSENAKGSVHSDQPNLDNVENEESKTTADNGNLNESKGDDEEGEKVNKNSKENEADEEDEDEYGVDSGDKLFDDVDKDLGNILREAEAGARSSDDEDTRYDRFRNTGKKHAKEKNGEGKQVDDKEAIVKKSETKPKATA